jgi:hypothetical protein
MATPHRPAHPLLHPLALAAVALLVINDHLLKARYPGWITGKLSDVAGLVFFPLLVAALWELGGGPGARRTAVLTTAVLTALGFALVQLWPPASQAYCAGLGALQWPFLALHAVVFGHALPGLPGIALTPDPSDLIAVPAALVPIWLVWPGSRVA